MSDRPYRRRGRRALTSAMLPGAKRDDVVRLGVVLAVGELRKRVLASLQQFPTVLPEFVRCAITKTELQQAVAKILPMVKWMASERNALRFTNEVKCACEMPCEGSCKKTRHSKASDRNRHLALYSEDSYRSLLPVEDDDGKRWPDYRGATAEDQKVDRAQVQSRMRSTNAPIRGD